jgi:hypothetical protein
MVLENVLFFQSAGNSMAVDFLRMAACFSTCHLRHFGPDAADRRLDHQRRLGVSSFLGNLSHCSRKLFQGFCIEQSISIRHRRILHNDDQL